MHFVVFRDDWTALSVLMLENVEHRSSMRVCGSSGLDIADSYDGTSGLLASVKPTFLIERTGSALVRSDHVQKCLAGRTYLVGCGDFGGDKRLGRPFEDVGIFEAGFSRLFLLALWLSILRLSSNMDSADVAGAAFSLPAGDGDSLYGGGSSMILISVSWKDSRSVGNSSFNLTSFAFA